MWLNRKTLHTNVANKVSIHYAQYREKFSISPAEFFSLMGLSTPSVLAGCEHGCHSWKPTFMACVGHGQPCSARTAGYTHTHTTI